MGKINKMCVNNQFGYHCNKIDTTRWFNTQKEVDRYVTRHSKNCDCNKSCTFQDIKSYYGKREDEIIQIN